MLLEIVSHAFNVDRRSPRLDAGNDDQNDQNADDVRDDVQKGIRAEFDIVVFLACHASVRNKSWQRRGPRLFQAVFNGRTQSVFLDGRLQPLIG